MHGVINTIKPNQKQQECIDTIKGSVMVLAGPGTGKTFVVIERIKNMLSKGIEAGKILCLTFSDAAASEMKKRLVEKAGNIASGVNVYTYHSFCLEIIQNYTDYFEEFAASSIIDDTSKRNLIKECIEELGTEYFKTASGEKYFHANTILSRIDEIKKNLISKDEYFKNLKNHPDWKKGLDEAKERIKNLTAQGKKVTKKLESEVKDLEKKIGQALEVWEFYELYTQKMRQNHLIDFNDMIALVLKKFEDSPSFLSKAAKDYDYFLVDEYQDTNTAQNTLIFNLVDIKEEKNIFVVGDDDQIIFGFQGAQVDNIEKFLEKYPDTKVICLEENMRSTQPILDLSEFIAKEDPNRLEANPKFKNYGIKKHLSAKNPELMNITKMPVLRLFDDISQEYNAIADEIECIINSNDAPPLNEIAVLTKTNGELEEFLELFKSRNIPCELKDGKSIFSIKSTILVIFYLKMLSNRALYADKIFPLLLSEPFLINIHDYNDILAHSRFHNTSDFISDIYEMKEHKWVDGEKIKKFAEDYEYLNEAKNTLNLHQLVLEVINRTGMLEFFLKNEINREENLAALKKITQEARDFIKVSKTAILEDFIAYLDEALENGTAILAQKSPVRKNAVQLITLHSSKGREFEYVFIPTLEEYKWERSKNDTISPKIPLARVISEDEKEALKISEKIKLLFVGITRAKHTLVLSMPKTIGGKEKKLTKFIQAVSENYLIREEVPLNEDNYIKELIKCVKYDYDYKKDFKNHIQCAISQLSISPTMLNTYIRCPRQFLYTYILKISGLKGIDDRLNYGSAVHKAIENFSKKAKSEKCWAPLSEFLKEFEAQCAKTPFSLRKTRKYYLDKGLSALKVFYSQLIQTPVDKIFSTEINIEAKIGTEITINGKIDRLQSNDDGSFEVLDFKTGSAKKSYEIKEGGAYESYLNQLQFYKYLAERKFENKVSSASLVFVEQCSDNYHTQMSEEDNITIENKIKEVYSNISSQNFEPSCDEKACKFCQYKDLCTLNLL